MSVPYMYDVLYELLLIILLRLLNLKRVISRPRVPNAANGQPSTDEAGTLSAQGTRYKIVQPQCRQLTRVRYASVRLTFPKQDVQHRCLRPINREDIAPV
jgi:hypothetical protein